MGIDRNRADRIRELLATKKILSLQWIANHESVNERTVQRHLRDLQVLSSFTHKRQFVTLPTAPRFDDHGVWFHRDIGFSKFGNSLDTIVALIEHSKKGLSRHELEAILRIGIAQQIRILLQREKLYRVKLGSSYLYIPEAAQKNKKERIKLIGDRQSEEYFEKDILKSDLIALLKAVLVEKRVGVSIESIKRITKKYSLKIPVEKIHRMLVKYNLSEKKTP